MKLCVVLCELVEFVMIIGFCGKFLFCVYVVVSCLVLVCWWVLWFCGGLVR